MAREIYDTDTLLGVYAEQEAPTNFWLNLLFPNQLNFEDEWVDFEKIPSQGRPLAPFVMPLAQGRPIYKDRSRVQRFKPAYIKPKDPITPSRVISRRPGEILQRVPDSPEARYNAIVGDITQFHRTAIERTWEWLAAQAALYGAVTIESPDYPEQVIDFGRDAGHTITLGGGSRWGDAGVSILDNIESWMDIIHNAEFGGMVTHVVVGSSAWAKMRKDAEVKDMLDINYRGETGVTIQRGITPPAEVRYVGDIAKGVQVWVYKDYYTVNGVVTPFMDPRDVLLCGPGFNGYRCFGAILDPNANYQPLEVFPRMFVENDPPVTHIMTQSAPLMVPVMPNNTLRARVVA